MNKELIVRRNNAYFRRSPDRSLEKANYNRMRTLLAFGEGAQNAYGGSYEEVIKSITDHMKKLPPPEEKIKHVVELNKSDLGRIKFEMLRKGLRKIKISKSQLIVFQGRILKEITL